MLPPVAMETPATKTAKTAKTDEDRKNAHLRICLEEPVEPPDVTTGFERYRFEHDALPELSRTDIDLSTTALGKRLELPLMIGAMTGGTERAGEINRILAAAAQECGVAMGLGSQRKMLESPKVAETFRVRDVAPDILLFGNIGAVQLNYGVTIEHLLALCQAVRVDALTFHLNPLHESIQPEGDTDFRGLAAKLREAVAALPVPALVKEVGAGLSEKTLRKLADIPFAGVETAGAGGTSWTQIETYRTASWVQQRTGRSLASWGEPTAEALLAAVRVFGPPSAARRLIICSGGIRSGLEVAKAIALGADMVACALPFLKAAVRGGKDAVVQRVRQFEDELRTILFITGSRDLAALRTQTLMEVSR